MREVFLGDYIKQKRLDMGLTQVQLCEGICEPITISRMENGQQTPSRTIIKAILERLGLPDDRYFALLSDQEMEIVNLKNEITADSIRQLRTPKNERAAIRAHALEKLAELEQIARPDDRITQQCILGRRAYFGEQERLYSDEEQLDMVMKAIQLTVPRFNLDKINPGLYDLTEIHLINQIAVIYSRMGQQKKAADIYHQLLIYIEKHNKNLAHYGKDFCMIAYNYAIQLGSAKCHDESIHWANRGWKMCIECGDYLFLPGLLAILAENYYFIGDIERSTDFYMRAYYIYQAVQDKRNLRTLTQEMEERLGLHMPVEE